MTLFATVKESNCLVPVVKHGKGWLQYRDFNNNVCYSEEFEFVESNAAEFVLSILAGKDLETVARELNERFGIDNTWAGRVGYWVDCCRLAEVESGIVSSVEHEWQDCLKSLTGELNEASYRELASLHGRS
jgi:hypothetical protein